MTLTLEVISILLSIVAFTVTVLGFFASLKFYRDGVELQRSANDALTSLTERTAAIQSQVGSRFDRTLDVALGRRQELEENFGELESQLDALKETLVSDAITQVGEATNEQRTNINSLVEQQIIRLKETVEDTRESAQSAARVSYKLARSGSVSDLIVGILEQTGEPLSRSEIFGILVDFGYASASSNLSRRLRELQQKGLIVVVGEGGSAKYALTTHGRNWVRTQRDHDVEAG